MSVYNLEGVEINAAYSVDDASLADVYDVDGTRIGFSEPERQWLDTAVITGLPNISVTGVKQGGCTDGTYIYQCSGDSSNYTYMTIIKYKIADGTYTSITYNGTPNFGHANDMTYNPNTGYLYVCTMLSDGSVIVLDASDLSYVDTIYITNQNEQPYAVWQFCYDREHDCYYSSYGAGICVYDSDWSLLEYRSMDAHPSATGQGCETDGEYYYRITYNPNLVNVCTLTGEFVKNITNPAANEPEAIMYDWDGHFYFSKYNGSPLFSRIQLYE